MKLSNITASKLCAAGGDRLCSYLRNALVQDIKARAPEGIYPNELNQMLNWIEQLALDIEAGKLPEVGQ